MSANAKSLLVTFIGTTPNIGTTTAAFAAAYRLAEMLREPVGYLCLNLKSAKLHRYLRVDRPAVTLDRLRPELQSSAMTPAVLRQAMYRLAAQPNLNVLFGSLMRDQAEFYTPAEVDNLLRAAREMFRITVADVGPYWDNAATVAAVRSADTRILATTGALSHFQEDGRRWIGQLSPLFGVPSGDYELLLIHPPWKNGGYAMKDVRKELELPAIGELKLTEPLLSGLDSGRLEEWLRDNEQGKRAMKPAAEGILRRHGMLRPPDMRVQPWYRRLAAYREGAKR